jgi:hypothetical protein
MEKMAQEDDARRVASGLPPLREQTIPGTSISTAGRTPAEQAVIGQFQPMIAEVQGYIAKLQNLGAAEGAVATAREREASLLEQMRIALENAAMGTQGLSGAATQLGKAAPEAATAVLSASQTMDKLLKDAMTTFAVIGGSSASAPSASGFPSGVHPLSGLHSLAPGTTYPGQIQLPEPIRTNVGPPPPSNVTSFPAIPNPVTSFPAIPMAAGGSGIAKGPTLFLAGENGEEPYAFGDQAKGVGSTVIQVDARGATFENDRALDRLADKIAKRMGERAGRFARF